MKIKKTKNILEKIFTKKNIIVICIIIGILILAFGLLILTGVIKFDNNTQTADQIQETTTNAAEKKKFIEQSQPTTTDKTNNNTGTIPTPTADNISLSTQIESDGSLTVMTQLVNYSDGNCDLTVSNGNNLITKSAIVIYQPTFSTCAGFNIPASELGSGNWQISLSVTSEGQVNTKTTSVEIQ